MLNIKLAVSTLFSSIYWLSIRSDLSIFYFLGQSRSPGTLFFRVGRVPFYIFLGKGRLFDSKRALIAEQRSKLFPLMALVCSIDSLVYGYRQQLKLHGVGFRFSMLSAGKLCVAIGYSHSLIILIPHYVIVAIIKDEKGQQIEFFGLNAAKTEEIVFRLMQYRWPDAYKGKGIRRALHPFFVKPRKK